MAWTFFEGESRRAFRAALAFDNATWARTRGWALWKAAITLARDPSGVDGAARRWGWRVGPLEVIEAVLAQAETAPSS